MRNNTMESVSNRQLKNNTSFGQAVRNSFTMAYRGLLKTDGGLGYVAIAGLLVIVCSWAISWIFAFFGVIARTASSVQGISMLVLFPLTFLSNAFVPVETMPN